MTKTLDQLYVQMTQLCVLQAQVNALKEEIGAFLQPGETSACELGKLTMTKEVETFTWNAEGKRQYQAFKDAAAEKGLGRMTITRPQLRLTLNSAKDGE
jgi:hypothetical protein